MTPLPTPYWSDGQVEVYCGDCRELLPRLRVAADVAIVDPPYGDTALSWDQLTADWVPIVGRQLTVAASLWLWGSLRSLVRMAPAMEADGWSYSQDVVWEKHNGSGAAADRFRRVHEHAVLWYRGRWGDVYHQPQHSLDATARTTRRKAKPQHWGDFDQDTYLSHDGGPRLARSVIYARSAHGRAIHPTQKPEAVTRLLVGYSCPPRGLILDPYMGSATTGRRAIGIEVDEATCARAVARLSQGVLINETDVSPGRRPAPATRPTRGDRSTGHTAPAPTAIQAKEAPAP